MARSADDQIAQWRSDQRLVISDFLVESFNLVRRIDVEDVINDNSD